MSVPTAANFSAVPPSQIAPVCVLPFAAVGFCYSMALAARGWGRATVRPIGTVSESLTRAWTPALTLQLLPKDLPKHH